MFAPPKKQRKSSGKPRKPRKRQEKAARIQADVPYPYASTMSVEQFPRTRSRYAITNKSTIKALLSSLGFTRISDTGYEIFTRLLDHGVERALMFAQQIRDASPQSKTFGTKAHYDVFHRKLGPLFNRKVPRKMLTTLQDVQRERKERGRKNFQNISQKGKNKMLFYRILTPFVKKYFKKVKSLLAQAGYATSTFSIMDSADWYRNNPKAVGYLKNYFQDNDIFAIKGNRVLGDYTKVLNGWMLAHNEHSKKKERMPLTEAEYAWVIYVYVKVHSLERASQFARAYHGNNSLTVTSENSKLSYLYNYLAKSQRKTFTRLVVLWSLDKESGQLTLQNGEHSHDYEAFFHAHAAKN